MANVCSKWCVSLGRDADAVGARVPTHTVGKLKTLRQMYDLLYQKRNYVRN